MFLEGNESRDCNNANNNYCEKNLTPDVSTYSFNFTNIMPEDSCNEREITRTEMLQKIRGLGFAVVELAEYLDTHGEDKNAIALHSEYTNELRELSDKYQKVYGPLTITFPCNKWRWLEEPWPWERGNF